MPMHILYEDNHLLAVGKPAGLPSQPDASGDAALIDEAREWVRRKYAKPGNVYLALLHRLDRPVSGAVLTARTEKAAKRMAEKFRNRSIEKRYLALVTCAKAPTGFARLRNRLAPSASGGVEAARGDGGKEARLAYTTLAASPDGKTALLEILLETGVKHQIRAQLAAAGLPVMGDFRYGAFGKPARPEPVQDGRAILLHAARLSFDHPVGKGGTRIFAPLPDYWRHYLNRFELLGQGEAYYEGGDAFVSYSL